MRSAQQREPELFEIVPGEPWTINGEPTEATTGQEAIDRVFSLATRFPARLHFQMGTGMRVLEMDKKGYAQLVPDASEEPEQEPAREESAPAPVVAPVITGAEDITPGVDAEPTARTQDGEDTEDTGRPRRFPTPARVAGAVMLVAVAGLGVLAVQGTGDDQGPDTTAQEPAQSPQGWTLPSGQSAVGIIGDRIITTEDTTVRLLDAETGEEAWSMDNVEDTAQVRSIDGTTASAMDPGTGEVAVLAAGEVSVLPGALNARGTEPVIVNEDIIDNRTYSTFDGTTRPLTDTQAVLGAIDQGAVLFNSPNLISVEGFIVQLAAPEAEATITQAIRVTDDRAVMVWSRGDTRWLVTHDLVLGRVESEEEIGAAEVTVRSGIVWIDSDRTLVGDEIRPVCEGGEQVNATIICPGPDGWESSDGTMQYPERPDVISPSYTVTAGTVTTQRNTP